jgi:hypothetical protein
MGTMSLIIIKSLIPPENLMESSPTLLLTIICGFFAILGGMLALVVFRARKEKTEKDKLAQALGFTEDTETPALLAHITSVNGITHPEMYHLTHVYKRPSSGGEVYLFNFHRRDIRHGRRINGSRTSKTGIHSLENNVIAFIAPAWHLPRFTASPRLSGGKLADLGNRVAEMAADIKLDIVKFPHIPTLDERYLIATPDGQLSLRDPFLQALASHPHLHLHAGGDTLTLSYANATTQPPDEAQMKKLYKIGLQLAKEIQAK